MEGPYGKGLSAAVLCWPAFVFIALRRREGRALRGFKVKA